jgi:hypothetical protein
VPASGGASSVAAQGGFRLSFCPCETRLFTPHAAIAQLDRATDYGSVGWGFDSSWLHHTLPLQICEFRPFGRRSVLGFKCRGFHAVSPERIAADLDRLPRRSVTLADDLAPNYDLCDRDREGSERARNGSELDRRERDRDRRLRDLDRTRRGSARRRRDLDREGS